VRYLLGDSSESGLEFNYLAFLREVVDCSVVLVEHELALEVAKERRKAREKDAHAQVQAIEELGKRAQALFGPLAKEHAEAPVGRAAAAIATAAREKIGLEASQIRSTLGVEIDAIEKDNQRLRTKSLGSLEKLLKAHDLPDATKAYEVLWTANGVKAQMRQRTQFGVEAVLTLDVPAASLFTMDLRVDRLADGVEVNALEAGGWLKKGDKLVPHKLGRYHITRVMVGNEVTIRLRTALDSSASGFDVIVPHAHERPPEAPAKVDALPSGILVDRIVGTPKELTIDKHQQAAFRQLADKLEAAARSLGEHRTALVGVEIDGTSIADHGHPLVFVERFILAIAPTVQRIARHSRSPGELVLRRLLGDDRREEIFVTTADLLKRIEGVSGKAREVFAPLHLEGGTPPASPRTRPPSILNLEKKVAPPPPPVSPSRPLPRIHPATIDLDNVEELTAETEASESGTIPVSPADEVSRSSNPDISSVRKPALIVEDEPEERPRTDTGEPEIEVSREPSVIVDDAEPDKSEPRPKTETKAEDDPDEPPPAADDKPRAKSASKPPRVKLKSEKSDRGKPSTLDNAIDAALTEQEASDAKKAEP
jgi:hypothetical protein